MADAKVIITAQSELEKGLNKAKYQLQDFGQAASTVGKSISSVISKHAGIAALVGSITALGAAAKKCADEYLGAARENDRFAATMENLSKTTGVQIRELKQLADAYEQSTYFTAEAVQAAGQLLLATGEISKEAFPRALEATLDLAEAMGQDATAAASSMQKALADPESGLKSLRTAGINFTDAEEDLIKSLVESNQKLEAQELILKKVEERYAGVAKAVADTPAGKLDAIKDTWGALKESIGEGIIDDLDPVFTWIHQQLDRLNKRLEKKNEIEFFTNISEVGRLSNYSDYETFKAITDTALKELEGAQERFYSNFSIMRQWGYEYDIHVALDTQDAELLEELEKYGIKVDIDQETGKFIIPELDRALGIIKDYQNANPYTTIMGMSNDDIKELITTLEEENAHLTRLIDATEGYTSEVVVSLTKSRKEQLAANEKQLEFLRTQIYEPDGDSGTPDALSNASSYIENFIEDAFVSTLDSYGKEIYDINKQIVELQSAEIDPKYRAEVDRLISDLIKLGDSVVTKRAEAEAKEEEEKKAAEEAKKTADSIRDSLKGLSGTEDDVYSLYQILDEIVKSGDEGLMSLFDDVTAKIAEIYDAIDAAIIKSREEAEEERIKAAAEEEEAKKKAAEEAKKAAEENLTFVENALISSRLAQAERLKQLQAEAKAAMEAHKVAKAEEEALKAAERAATQLIFQQNAIAKGQLRQAERRKQLEEAAEKSKEEYEKRQALKKQWETGGFGELQSILEQQGKELNLDNIFGAFTAEFSRVRDPFGDLLGPLDSLLGALDPLLDIVLSADPLLTIIIKILESFVEVIGSAISTTIAPFFDFLDEIGTLLGEVFLPLFNSLYPSINMLTEMLRMFLVPCLQILEPIINTLTIAFDALAGIVAIVGAVLTPFAAALEFIMDIFGYFGELMLTVGENIGIAFHNMTHWFDQREFKEKPEFHSDAFDNFGEKMDKWFHMMEDDQVVSDSVSQQIATSNATYTGAVTVHLNVYQNAPVVGEDGMTQFAMMIRDKFEELDYYAA